VVADGDVVSGLVTLNRAEAERHVRVPRAAVTRPGSAAVAHPPRRALVVRGGAVRSVGMLDPDGEGRVMDAAPRGHEAWPSSRALEVPMRRAVHRNHAPILHARAAPTTSEALLWEALRGSQLGVGFRRQVPIGRYIVDFAAPGVGRGARGRGRCRLPCGASAG
jgi:Protein of unknown function (DUF559)